MKKMLRREVERKCQSLLQVAANSIDTRGTDPYYAYTWAQGRLDGMADVLLIISEFELLHMVRYYSKVAGHKIDRALGR